MSARVPACPVGPQVRVDDGDADELPRQAAAAGPGPRADGPSPLRSARGAGREREREREGWREGRKEGWRAGANPLVVFPSFSPWYPLVVRLLSACCPPTRHLFSTTTTTFVAVVPVEPPRRAAAADHQPSAATGHHRHGREAGRVPLLPLCSPRCSENSRCAAVANRITQLNRKFKFGILQAKAGQTTEAEFFMNSTDASTAGAWARTRRRARKPNGCRSRR